MSIDFISIGHIINETIKFPEYTIGPVLGSPAAYSALTASKLGAKVAILTKIGTDFPKELLKPFYEMKIDTAGIKIEGNESTTNILTYNKAGKKEFLYLKKASPILSSDIPKDYLKARLALICPMDGEVSLEVVKIFKESGALIAIDIDGYGGRGGKIGKYLIEKSIKNKKEAIKELIKIVKYSHIVKIGYEDSLHLFKIKRKKEEDILKFLIKEGAKIGIITLGKRGSIVATNEDIYRIPAIPANVIDTTGGGDAFIAGFLIEYLRTNDAFRSALFGSAVASIIIEKSGGAIPSRMPSRDTVYERILNFLKL
ncbi:MAG: carbohydrate kinase family protein [Candidatus Micrarchaeia archaeon]